MRFKKANAAGMPMSPKLTLVALIDVCLFLLLYFMIASTFAGPESQLASGIRTEKPGSGAAQDLQPLILEVTLDGVRPSFRLGQRVMGDREALLGVLQQLPKGGGVVVRVAGEVPVEGAAAAIQACKDAGFVKVSYVPAR